MMRDMMGVVFFGMSATERTADAVLCSDSVLGLVAWHGQTAGISNG